MSSEPLPAPAALADRTEFCRACARFTTGVTVVTVADSAGQPHGMTVNSFTSVSLDPLMYLVCIDNRARVNQIFEKGIHIAVNILGEEQQAISSRFARPHDDRFATVDWAPGATGAPLISGALAMIEGVVIDKIPAGDHTILLTEVRSTNYRDGRPLVFFGSKYQKFGEIAS